MLDAVDEDIRSIKWVALRKSGTLQLKVETPVTLRGNTTYLGASRLIAERKLNRVLGHRELAVQLDGEPFNLCRSNIDVMSIGERRWLDNRGATGRDQRGLSRAYDGWVARFDYRGHHFVHWFEYYDEAVDYLNELRNLFNIQLEPLKHDRNA